ncbi:ABC transporter permease [Halalkalibacter urbisdiaboli]|uniref:ABC transporter permease n=1 Tax=Halalkalibacter urbisdiaboli TaxID=1960589 RepID=UPI000B4451A3|nr:ABC transporter permease [Halalkalibacter urbisdiaboli]
MRSVFLLQWQRFRRVPFLVLSFFVLTIGFVYILAGAKVENQVTVLTYFNASVNEEDKNGWLARLNKSDNFHFEQVEERQARKAVSNGDSSLALHVMEADYRLLIATEDPTHQIVEDYIRQVFIEELQLRTFEQLGGGSEFRVEVEQLWANPVLTVNTSYLEGTTGNAPNDERLQILFGMTLFFSIYTIMFSLMKVAEEKNEGTWDRLIVSPLRKSQIYMGHLLYCFLIGYAQIIVVFLLFQWGLGFDLGGRFGTVLVVIGCYVFSIVALGMLLIGLVKTSQQVQVAIPIIATAMAMIGGAYWPIEVVTNEVMLLLSKGMPIFYGMEALKEAVIFDRGVLEVIESLSILVLFGVVCMGVGINLMERRSV